MGEEELDERREAAIASTSCLQLQKNSPLKPTGVTSQQLAKLQELHRRRLKIKSKSKLKRNFSKNSQDETRKCQHEDTNPRDFGVGDEDASIALENSSLPNIKTHNNSSNSSLQQENAAGNGGPKKRQKLHWGYFCSPTMTHQNCIAPISQS